LFGPSKLLYISDITKRIGNFFKLPIQLFQSVSYPELALVGAGHLPGPRGVIAGLQKAGYTVTPVR